MLKGHVFQGQVFGNQIFALFINTFLNGTNGVSKNYKDNMAVTYLGNNVHISSGAACVQGRFVEEDSGTDITVSGANLYCSLVIEIDLNEVNTEQNFLQASYKIITNTSNYPTLTKNDIVKNNSGIYQFEIARFQTDTNGITNFQDKRTFLDIQSIYDIIEAKIESMTKEFDEKLNNVEDGSAYFLNSRFKVFHNTANDSQGKEGDIGIIWFD